MSKSALSFLSSSSASAAERPWLALPLLALISLWSVLVNGLPQGVDSHIHIARVALLDYALRHGTPYPRWFPELMLGHGYPVLNYYAPLAYYLIELWRLLGAGYYLAYAVSSGLVVLIAGCGMYLLARAVFGVRARGAALVAAAAYMFAPYLLTNIFVRGALPEALAQALLPWVFWSARGLVCQARPWRYVLPASVSLAALVLAHNLTLLFVPLPWLAYVAVLWWTRRRSSAALGPVAAAGALALGLTAFFWLPVLAERSYLAEGSLVVARTFLHENAWTWTNFLDADIAYRYSTAIPFRLGLVQVGLAVAGAVLARRRDREWIFWGALALLACLGIGAWALPVWLSNSTLQAVQFPWRLLSIVSLSLALATGGALLRLQTAGLRLAASLGLLALIVTANAAGLAWGPLFSEASTDVSAAVIAQVEVDANTLGTSSLQEFRPRWVEQAVALTKEPDAKAISGRFVPESGNAYDLHGTFSSETGGPLRFSTYYFPGWQVRLDGRVVPVYPSTNLGLLTVDLPAGSHRLSLSFDATGVQRAGEIVTLLTLAVLALLLASRRVGRGWAVVFVVLFAAGVLAVALPRRQVPIRPPAEEVAGQGLGLAGYRVEFGAPAGQFPYLYVYPEWFVSGPQPTGWSVRWGLLDSAGQIVAETVSKPWYNSASAANWPPGTLIRDAYQVPLPPGLQAGTYQLAVQLPASGNPASAAVRLQSGSSPSPAPGSDATWRRLGNVTLTQSIPSEHHEPTHAAAARLDDGIRLAGYDVEARGRPAAPEGLLLAKPGDNVDYALYWQATSPVSRSYHGFVHLLNQAGQPIAGRDQLPGPIFRPSLLWDNYRLQRDWYSLQIPAGAPSGIYWPSVGLYDFDTRARLSAFDPEGQLLQDGIRLSPLKIINSGSRAPARTLDAHFAGLGRLQGYDLEAPARLEAGQALTLTLNFKCEEATPANYARFVHLSDAAGALVAGADGVPQGGANPTWSWQPGETIADQAVLTVPPGTPPGVYRLSTGLYDPEAGGARVPVVDSQGRAWPDARVPLAEVQIGP